MISAAMFEWYDVPAMVVYVAWWFGVALLLLALSLLLSLAFRLRSVRDRVCAGLAACFISIEVLALFNLYLQVNTPNWFEHLFVFNGFALPAQLILVTGAVFSSGETRSKWLLGGVLPGLASVPFFVLAAKAAIGASDA